MILPKTMRDDVEEQDRVATIIRLTKILCCQPAAFASNLINLVPEIVKIMYEWAGGGRVTPPYIEEVVWADPFIFFLQTMSDSFEVYYRGESYFFGLNNSLEHLHAIMRMALQNLGVDISGPYFNDRRNCPEGLPSWWHETNIVNGAYSFADFELSKYVYAFASLAESPVRRHMPDGCELKREYTKLNDEFSKFFGIVHAQAEESKPKVFFHPSYPPPEELNPLKEMPKKEMPEQNAVDVKESEEKQVILVEITEDSVKKLAYATGNAVKRAIRPGKGAANERYAHKDELMRIWEKYSKDETLSGSINHKVYHRDVFNYPPANKEIAALKSDPPITLEEFERSLGAFSDRKSRQSPAKRNKPR